MVESQEENYESIPTKAGDVNKTAEPVVSRPQLITSSFRSAVKLLRENGGYRGRFRGLGMYVVHNLAVNLVASMFAMVTGFFLPVGFYTAIAYVVCAQLSLGWTLVVITENSAQSWYQRIPSRKTWKKIAGPTAVYAIVEQVTSMGPMYLLIGTGLTKDPKEISKLPTSEQKVMAGQVIGIIILQLALTLVALLPARVVLTRMQASLVSDSENTIVPFDRTFGDRFVAESEGGRGVISACAAWRTFDSAARVRLVKAYLKCFAMIMGTFFFFSIIVGGFVASTAVGLY